MGLRYGPNALQRKQMLVERYIRALGNDSESLRDFKSLSLLGFLGWSKSATADVALARRMAQADAEARALIEMGDSEKGDWRRG